MIFVRKENLDDLINIPTKAEERSMIQTSFWIQDSNIETTTIGNPLENSQLIYDPLRFQNPQKSTIRALLNPIPSIRKPIHPPPLSILKIPKISASIRYKKTREVSATYANCQFHIM